MRYPFLTLFTKKSLKKKEENDKSCKQNYTKYVFELSRSDDREKGPVLNVNSRGINELDELNTEDVEQLIVNEKQNNKKDECSDSDESSKSSDTIIIHE